MRNKTSAAWARPYRARVVLPLLSLALSAGAVPASAAESPARAGAPPTAATAPPAAAPGTPAAAPAIEAFPESEIRPGLKGEVRTVLRGTEVETIEVEILGVLEDGIAPGIDMILGRLLGEKGNWNGVAAGMSGSPVTIGGRLVGALSYSIGQFSKEPLLGITPIRQMLALKEYPGGVLPWRAGTNATAAGFVPAPLALVAPGVAPASLDAVDDLLKDLGLVRSVASISAPAGRTPVASRLQPGDPVSALLVWGDVKLGATGTITWREGDRLLAFGHPFMGSGRAEMPVAASEIVWTVPSLMNSFKIARIGEPAGTLRQDRLTAIAADLGPVPKGLPVAVTIRRPNRPVLAKRFEVLRDPFLAPLLATVAFRIALLEGLGAERDEGLRMDGTLYLAGGRRVRFNSGSIPSGSFGSSRDQQLGLELLQRVNALLRAPMDVPEIERVELTVDAQEPETAWAVQRALPDRLAARPGDTLRVLVDLEETRGAQRQETFELTLPKALTPGSYTLLAGSSRTLAGEFGSVAEARRRTARSADEYLAALDDVPPDDRLEVALARGAEGIVAGGRSYPALPGSAHLLMRSRPGGSEMYRARWQAEARSARDLGRTVTEVARVTIEILPESSR